MSKTLTEHQDDIHVAGIVHHGEQITLPEGMEIGNAIKLLERRREYLEEKTHVVATFEAFPWDGAYALNQVLAAKFGWASAEPTPGFFGDNPPSLIDIEVGFNETAQVPWGRFSLPTIPGGFVECGGTKSESGLVVFQLTAMLRRRYVQVAEELFEDVRNYLRHKSIYQGKAFRISFTDEDGDSTPLPKPSFLDTNSITREQLIYSREVEQSVSTSLFTPIERIQDCIENDIPVKRGIMLGGVYGTGKTLAATVASRLAVENGVTYIYVPRAAELSKALKFAALYQEKGCVVFCEDIDREMSGERSVKMDDILNILDGVESKNSRIITVLTTNHLENINPAMLRPGRLDAIINITPPDAEAVGRLITYYGKGAIEADADLTPVSDVLAGSIPAIVEEVVKRAKLSQLSLQAKGTKVEKISGEALLVSAHSMKDQIDLLAKASGQNQEVAPTLDALMGQAVEKGVRNATKKNLHAPLQ